MYLLPLSQLESVELVIHCLQAAGGQAECRQCPAYRVCTKQCLAIAAAVEKMLHEGHLPMMSNQIGNPMDKTPGEDLDRPDGGNPGGKGRLKVVK